MYTAYLLSITSAMAEARAPTGTWELIISSNYLLQRHLSMIFLILKVARNGTPTLH